MSEAFNYKLYRYSSKQDSTLGLLMTSFGDNGEDFRCYTLEDEHRDIKVNGKTRIPAGKYEIKLRTAGGMHERYTKRFDFHQGMLWLQDVPGFEWIYIHPGNNHEHTEGCILTGDGTHGNILSDGSVVNSTPAYERLYKEITKQMALGKRIFIEIVDHA